MSYEIYDDVVDLIAVTPEERKLFQELDNAIVANSCSKNYSLIRRTTTVKRDGLESIKFEICPQGEMN